MRTYDWLVIGYPIFHIVAAVLIVLSTKYFVNGRKKIGFRFGFAAACSEIVAILSILLYLKFG